MSDDLISRKTLLDYIDVGHLRNSDEKCFSERDVVEMIKEQPAAFDKEKVIEEFMKYSGHPCTLNECGIRSEYCSVCMEKKAIEIVEKGGIE